MNIYIWTIIGSATGALSFIFAVYTYFKSQANNRTEKAKIEIYKERLKSVQFQLVSALHSTDAIVQLSKQDTATVKMLQNMARITRGQLFTTIKQVEEERKALKSWRYGKMIKSLDEVNLMTANEENTKP